MDINVTAAVMVSWIMKTTRAFSIRQPAHALVRGIWLTADSRVSRHSALPVRLGARLLPPALTFAQCTAAATQLMKSQQPKGGRIINNGR